MPALEQLNVRVTANVKKRFRERARREGLSQAALLEALLNQRGVLEVNGHLPTPDPYEQSGPQPQATVRDATVRAVDEDKINFPTWLQGRAQVPRALAASAVRAGRVHVAGVPYTAEEIPLKLLKTTVVVYEGREL